MLWKLSGMITMVGTPLFAEEVIFELKFESWEVLLR